MTNQVATVMGPGEGATPNRILIAPRLTTTTDKLKWRTDVRMWATSVELYANGGDTRSKGMMSALGITLYHAVDEAYRSKLDRAIAAGTLKLKPDADDTPKKVQQAAIETIIEIVAKDSVTDSIRRLVQMMRDIYTCKRKTGETPAAFSRRFQGLALKYLNHCGSTSTENDSQNFAMLLLENSNIPSSVYSSIVTQLVSKANERGNKDDDKICLVTTTALQAISESANETVGNYMTWRSTPKPQLPKTDSDCVLFGFESVKEEINKIIQQNERLGTIDRSRFSITLEDAVGSFCDIKVDDVDTTSNSGPSRVMQGSLLGKRFQPYSNGGSYKSAKTHIPVGTGPKTHTKCRSCDQPGHWWRDTVCPKYNENMKIIDAKRKQRSEGML